LSCAVRGWFKGIWHQLAFPVALAVFVGLQFWPATNLLRVVTGGELLLSLIAFRGWKWLTAEWPRTNDEPNFLGRQLLGWGGAIASVVTGVGFLWLVLLVSDVARAGSFKEELAGLIHNVTGAISVLGR
jgi:hypothetical protein